MPIKKPGQSPFRPTTRDEVLAMLLVVETELPSLMEPWKALIRELDTVTTPGGMSEDEWKNRITPIKDAVTNLLQERGLAEGGFNGANYFQCIGLLIGERIGRGIPERYAFLRSDEVRR